MKTKQFITLAGAVLAAMLTIEPASAFYNPQTGRWLSRDPLGEESFLASHSKGRPRVERARLRRDALRPAYGFVQNDPVIGWDLLGLRFDCTCSQADAEWLARQRTAQYLPFTQTTGREVLGKICCHCEGTVTPGTVVVAPEAAPHRPNPALSECPPGSHVLAIWHTHPEDSPWQNTKADGSGPPNYGFDLHGLRGWEAGAQGCTGMVFYMSNKKGRLTKLDPSGNELEL